MTNISFCRHMTRQAAWETGALASVGLSRAEVVRFINAVFSDSQLRSDCIARVMALAYHEHETLPQQDEDDDDMGDGRTGVDRAGDGTSGDSGTQDGTARVCDGDARRQVDGGGLRIGGGGLTSFLLRQGGALGMIAPAPACSALGGGGGNAAAGGSPNI